MMTDFFIFWVNYTFNVYYSLVLHHFQYSYPLMIDIFILKCYRDNRYSAGNIKKNIFVTSIIYFQQ